MLVIGKAFTTQRDALQGLMRVGRFGDDCVRILVKGVELFDAFTNSAHYQAFFRFAQRIVPKKSTKRSLKALGKQSQPGCAKNKESSMEANPKDGVSNSDEVESAFQMRSQDCSNPNVSIPKQQKGILEFFHPSERPQAKTD